MTEFIIYIAIGSTVYIFLSIKNVIMHIRKGMTKNDAIHKEFSEGIVTELIMLGITLIAWPIMIIFLIKNILVEYFAEREIKK